jgi:radical SAM protein (TIGR01212 family)
MGLKVCVHVIFGFPNETFDMMLETVKFLSELGIDAIKFHHLQIVKDTKLADIYLKHPFDLITEEQYIELIARSLELLPKNVIIQRLVGSTKKDYLLAPDWPSSTVDFLNKLKNYLNINKSYQGKFYNASLF